MKPSNAIARYNTFCNEYKLYENDEARSEICSVCVIEIGRNQSILEDQISLNGGMQNV